MPETDWYKVDVITCAAPNLRDKSGSRFNQGKVIEFAVYCGSKDNRNFKTFERVFKVYEK